MLKVFPSAINEMYLEWRELEGDEFRIYRSHSPDSDFEILVDGLTIPFHLDTSVKLYDEGVRYYYKVEGRMGGMVKSTSNVETSYYNQPDGIANKVIRESNVVLRVMNNPLVHILIRRRTGTPCPNCWNEITQRVRFANCTWCHGTGVLTGFCKPIPIRISTDMSYTVDASDMMDGNKVKLTPIQAWTVNKPILTPGDVVVDVMNRRFKIEQVIPRTKSQALIRQLFYMVPLEKGHPAYNVEVDRGVSVPWLEQYSQGYSY